MKRLSLPATLACLVTTLAGCGVDELDSSDAQLRAVVIADNWNIYGPVTLPDVNACEDYWNSLCAGLTADQCTLAHNRYTCTQGLEGVTITDNFGELASGVEWEGYVSGDEGLTRGDTPSEACSDPERCADLAAVAAFVDTHRSKLLSTYPTGGVAQLTIRDDVFMVEPPSETGEDLTLGLADALEWRLPIVGKELSLGKAGIIVIEDILMLTIRPNGTIGVSNFEAALMQRQKQPPPSTFDSLKTYSMSAPGASYSHGNIGVVGGWSRYAMQWKAYVDPNVGSVDLANSYMGNILHALVGSEVQLNGFEASEFTDHWGGTYDPNGTWMSEDIDDPLAGLAFAAMVMHYWRSPVFFDGVWMPPLSLAPSGAWYHEFALEQVTFRLPNAPDLHAACGISSTAPAVQALAAIQSCNLSGLTIENAVVTTWLGDYSPGNAPDLLHHVQIGGADLMSSYAAGFSWTPSSHSGRVGELVFDPPPEASAEEIAAVRELALVIADELRDQVPMDELVE